MDYLNEAIEKARKEREGSIGRTATPGQKADGQRKYRSPVTQQQPRPSTGATGLVSSSGRRSRVPASAQINYTTTRSTDLDPETLSRNRVIAGDKNDARVEAYRQLRTQVLSAMHYNSWRTLAITSAQEDAGKTLTSVNLAITISQEVNQTVMLVDLDLRDPSVHRTLGIEVEKGIVDHVIHGEPLENVLVNPGFPRLVVLPGLPQPHHASELITSPEMRNFLHDITNRYPDRIVIFDLPPLLRNDDAIVVVPNADACLLVVEDGSTRPDELERCVQLLRSSQLLGTVLNKAR